MKKNRIAIRHIFTEFFKKGNLRDYEQLIAENIHIHCPESWRKIHPSFVTTREGARKIDEEYARAFVMKNVEMQQIISDQNKVFVLWECHGIHLKKFFDFPATGKQFDLTGQTLYHFDKDYRVCEIWQSWDMLGLLKQIDISPISILTSLSTREKECLHYLLEGKTAKETAALLYLSPRTIEYYFENLKNKLDCSTKRELFKLARLMETQHLLI